MKDKKPRPKTVFVCGNPLLDFDNLPLRLLPELEREFGDIQFVEIDPNENLRPIDQELHIIDTAEKIEQVTIIDNIDQLAAQPLYSAHDLDLAFNLQLLHKLGQLKRFTIFALPMKGREEEIKAQLIKAIRDRGS